MIRRRYRRIVLFFARILLSFVVWDLVLPRLGFASRARRTRPARLKRSAVAYRALSVEMGGVLIKVGQFLSTRVDVLPPEVTNELAGLQDEVKAEKYDDIRRVAEEELGAPLDQRFAWFEQVPLAAASLGQVHRARLPDRLEAQGAAHSEHVVAQNPKSLDVVVKIQRPNIERVIATDLAALQTVGKWLNRYRPIGRRVNIPALLDEFTRILYEEIDYLAEGRNAETFAVNFEGQPGVRVPKVIWTHTTRRVLTLENVLAIKITDYQSITASGVDRADVASRLLHTYLQQIFEDGFFHADPHPGNLFILPLDGSSPVPSEGYGGIRSQKAWQLTFVDFGMVGHVPVNLRDGLREMLIGVGTQDAKRVVKSYQMLGVLLPSADLDLLERAEAKLFERFWGKDMSELAQINTQEVREFAHEFRELLYTLPFQVPHDLIFLARTVAILSGMCIGLDPNFNLWNHLAPYAKKMIAEEMRGAIPETWLAELGALARAMVSVPRKMDAILSKIDHGEVAVRAPEVTRQVIHLERAIRQVTGGLIFAAFLLGGIMLYIDDHVLFAALLLAGAGLSLVGTLFNGRQG